MARPLTPLADTLGVLLPDARDALLLRACLGDAIVAARAWEAWLSMTSGLPAALSERPASRGLLPLLHHQLSLHGISVSESSLAILRAASLWEERRAAQIRTILVRILAQLRKAGIGAILTNGAAAAASAYPKFALRHCHDIALLVEVTALDAARTALRAAGFTGGHAAARPGFPVLLHHNDGLPVSLHTALWPAIGQGGLLPGFRRRAGAIDIDGESVPVFAPMDMILHASGHSFPGPDPGNWAWVADVAMIQRRYQPSAEDWAGFVRMASESGLAFRLALRLDDLAARIGLPIPPAAVEALVAAAGRNSTGERDAALSAARGAFGMGLGSMFRQSGWRSRLDIARWALRRSSRLLRPRRKP